jgi:hypothetical protein
MQHLPDETPDLPIHALEVAPAAVRHCMDALDQLDTGLVHRIQLLRMCRMEGRERKCGWTDSTKGAQRALDTLRVDTLTCMHQICGKGDKQDGLEFVATHPFAVHYCDIECKSLLALDLEGLI